MESHWLYKPQLRVGPMTLIDDQHKELNGDFCLIFIYYLTGLLLAYYSFQFWIFGVVVVMVVYLSLWIFCSFYFLS